MRVYAATAHTRRERDDGFSEREKGKMPYHQKESAKHVFVLFGRMLRDRRWLSEFIYYDKEDVSACFFAM